MFTRLFGSDRRGRHKGAGAGGPSPPSPMPTESKSERGARRRLDRRNAVKNIHYDASPSSSGPTRRVRSMETSPSDPSAVTSFRIIDGQFGDIYERLGISSPEDFGIPAAAWEVMKARSASDILPRSRLQDLSSTARASSDPVALETGIREFNAESRGGNGLERAIVVSGGEAPAQEAPRPEDKARVPDTEGRASEYGERLVVGNELRDQWPPRRTETLGIKGVRPPALASPLAPPPTMSLPRIDNGFSTWDLFESLAPQDDERGKNPRVESSESEEEMDTEGEEEEEEEETVERIPLSSNISACCSFTTSNDDDSSTTTTESTFVSPIAKAKREIKSWQRGEVLGSGSFGTVYEGISSDGFFFAVKEVVLIGQGGNNQITQLEHEIALLSQFEHDNIVRYLGTDKKNDKLYIFLELVTQKSLASLYQKYDLQDSQVSVYTRQILNGLKYLHDKGVLHRDIKCANILVDSNGLVKLADFGLAKEVDKLHMLQSCKGSAYWMAPEVVNPRKTYGLPADIWSLGCTVLEMLTGQVPYGNLEWTAAIFKIGRNEPPPVPDHLSKDACDFINQCLQVDPDMRPTAAKLLDHPFVRRSSISTRGHERRA
ncbi:Mitogen-activated protein kinase kinase kinase 1 [Nymphaea thermarum]|nr:Mitogen-activated protein kinase kinase kinase 1 [Nymphaea thermarum]